MNTVKYHTFFHSYIALFIALFCVVPKLAAPSVLGLILIVAVGYAKRKLTFRIYRENLALIGLYLMYVAGILFTDHMSLAMSYAENKLSFILLPLLFMFRPGFKISLSPIIAGLNIGLVIAGIFGVFNSLSCLEDGGATLTCLTSVNFSPIHHPSYLSIFILVALFGNLILYRKKEKYFTLNWIIPLSLVLLMMLMLCLSLSVVLFFILVLSALAIRWLYAKMDKRLFWPLVLIVPFVLILVINYAPLLKEDVRYTANSFSTFVKDPVAFSKEKVGYTTGNEKRMIMWTATVEEIKDHPFGVGTGNIDDHLHERLTSYGQIKMALKDEKGTISWNPHNQFLQTTLEIGILGGLVLIVYFVLLLKLGLRNRSAMLLLITAAVIFNCLFESMYQRQSGILFFTFVISFLLLYEYQKAEGSTELNETIG